MNSAGKLINIKSNTEYGDNGEYIYAIQPLRTNERDVLVTTMYGTTVSFPSGSMVKGAMYPIFVKSMEFDEIYSQFIGYMHPGS